MCVCFAAFVCLFVLFVWFFLLLSSHKQQICVTGNRIKFKVQRECSLVCFVFSLLSLFLFICVLFVFVFFFWLLASHKQSTSCSWDAVIYGTQLTWHVFPFTYWIKNSKSQSSQYHNSWQLFIEQIWITWNLSKFKVQRVCACVCVLLCLFFFCFVLFCFAGLCCCCCFLWNEGSRFLVLQLYKQWLNFRVWRNCSPPRWGNKHENVVWDELG